MSGQELSRLVAILADGLRVLVKRGDAELTEDQIFERARNQAQAVMGVYFMVPRPEAPTAPDWDTPLISCGNGSPIETFEVQPEPPFRHMYGCACGSCPGEWTVNEAGRDERTKKETAS